MIQGYAGATEAFTIPAGTLAALNALTRETQSTLFMVLAAAFSLLLGRYAGQNDVCLGTPIANRNRSEIEPLIGFFVNTLVLRTDLDGNPRFVDLLAQMRSTILAAYEHQDLPFDQIVDIIKPERSTSHPPLFQAMLALQNTPMEDQSLPGITMRPLVAQTATAKVDLRLAAIETDGALSCFIEYKSDLFDATTIARMGRHFNCLLAAIAADPYRHVDALPMQDTAERQAIMALWDQVQPGFSQLADDDLLLPGIAHHVLDLFERAAIRHASCPALAHEARTLSYAQLDRHANQIAHALIQSGIGPGAVVALLLDDPVQHIAAMLGILKAGAVFVSLSAAYPVQRLTDMLAVAQPAAILSLPVQAALLDTLYRDAIQPPMVALDALDALPTARVRVAVAADAPCYLYFTSGSTGRPKAVLGRSRGLAHFIQWEIDSFGIDADSRVSQLTIPTFDGAAPRNPHRLPGYRAPAMTRSAQMLRREINHGNAHVGSCRSRCGEDALSSPAATHRSRRCRATRPVRRGRVRALAGGTAGTAIAPA